MTKRKGILVGFMSMVGVLALASTAAACVTFIGSAEVTGSRGNTEVVGTGNSHGYCSDGRPKTAAAGRLGDSVKVEVAPGACSDVGALATHQLPEGTYEVRYNNEPSYTYDGTYWNMTPFLGCFRAENANTSSIIGTFGVDSGGRGEWTGTLDREDLKGDPYFATPQTVLTQGTASNLCIGAPSLPNTGFQGGKPGILTPFQLVVL